MALDRQSIEKKDFPVGRRGYEPAAVDAHLSAISEEVEELKRAARKRSESLASSSSEHVRTIIDAAENSAAEIHRQAEEDAQEIRAEAHSEANVTRNHATSEAHEHVDKVSSATSNLLARVDAMQSELGSLFESVKAGANRIKADLQLLESNLREAREAVVPPRFEAESEIAAVPATGPHEHIAPEVPIAAERRGADAGEPAVATEAVDDVAAKGSPADAKGSPAGSRPAPTTGDTVQRDPTGGADDDAEGARLIALNMALNGTPREDTDRYLAQNFKLSNRAALLDEVYEKVEG